MNSGDKNGINDFRTSRGAGYLLDLERRYPQQHQNDCLYSVRYKNLTSHAVCMRPFTKAQRKTIATTELSLAPQTI